MIPNQPRPAAGLPSRYLLSPEEAAEKSADEINALLADEFSFDNFRWQQENGVLAGAAEPRCDGTVACW